MFKLRFGIRLKLALLSTFLFAIPWLGYQYVWEMESYLRLGQEQTLVGTARAVATALHERPNLFDKQASYLQDVKPGTDLYAHPIMDPVRLDGRLQDWLDYQHLAIKYDESYLLDTWQDYTPSDLQFTHMVGIFDIYLYAYFEVIDDQVVMRGDNSLRVDRNDFLHIALTDPQDNFRRYIVAARQSGWVNAFELDNSSTSYRPLNIESRIQGHWQETATGYNIELRIPLSMVSDKIAFMIGDVDSESSPTVELTIGTADPYQPDSLGTVLVPSPEIEKIVKGLQYSGARIWVLDKHRRVLARSGSILESSGISTKSSSLPNKSLWHQLEETFLLPFYYRILTRPPEEFIDELKDAFALEGKDISNALLGEPDTLWRLTPDNKAVVLSASHPIWVDEQVLGAVVVEQTTHGIRTLRNKALEKLFNVILLVMVLGTTALLLFASRISFRIRKLRDQTENAIDSNGRIVGNIPTSHTHDEIGDLSRTFHNVLEKLSQYHAYLENMASRLSHELRTPVAVVKSSLENLQMEHNGAEDNAYITRAHEGVNRLSVILNNMSEASRLEQALKGTEIEEFDLVALLNGVVHGYQLAYPTRTFKLNNGVSEFMLNGSADLFIQMLDKIVANAVDFSPEQSEVIFALNKTNHAVELTIANKGPLLPENMQEQLFDSMISMRDSSRQKDPHLGLGLFIARVIAEFHQASIQIHNLQDGSGVEVLLSLSKR